MFVDRVKIHVKGGDGGDLRDMPIWEYFKEVPLGQGGVHYDTYIPALHYAGFDGFLTIEREAGATPADDITLAANYLRKIIKEQKFF